MKRIAPAAGEGARVVAVLSSFLAEPASANLDDSRAAPIKTTMLAERLQTSLMCRDFAGQHEVKTGTARRVVGGPQAAAMRFNDGAADG